MKRSEPYIGAAKTVVCLVMFLLQLSSRQWMVNSSPLPRCADQQLNITADNMLVLFVDGVEVTDLQQANSAPHADTVPLPASTQVVAVNGKNAGAQGGFLGSASTFVTDRSWKCTDQFYEGWHDVEFNDLEWQAADVVGIQGDGPWHEVDGISSDAVWIWVSPDEHRSNQETDVYCRKSLVGNCNVEPTPAPTPEPTPAPTPEPTPAPTSEPTPASTPEPTPAQTPEPTPAPTPEPTPASTPEPTPAPTPEPTCAPTPEPTPTPTPEPTPAPTPAPTSASTPEPTPAPTPEPTPAPTPAPTSEPTPAPTPASTPAPTPAPTSASTPAPPCSGGSGGTGPSCITSCSGRANGDYQSCKGCQVYATCSNGLLYDDRPCAPGGLYWDDNVKRCEWESTTCYPCPDDLLKTAPPCKGNSGEIGASCITSCKGRANGNYKSCKGCHVYAVCSNGFLFDSRPCLAGMYWDDKLKRCK